MSNLNKIITNASMDLTPAEVSALSASLLPVVIACGGGDTPIDLSDYVKKTSFQPVAAAVEELQAVSSNGPAAYDVLTAYSAEGTWLTAHQSLSSKQDKLTFNKNASDELTGINDMPIAQPDTSNFLTKTNADTYYQPLPAAGIGYVTSSTTVITGTNQYALTSAGWTVIQGGGGGQGGIESVSHDITLTGDGNTTPLGVVTGTTMESALSAGVAEGLTNGTVTSALSDFVTALAGKQATGNYVSDDDLADYQTTAGMTDYYKKTDTSSKTEISTALESKADATSLNSYLTKSDAESTYQPKSLMVNYLTTTTYGTDKAGFMKTTAVGAGLSGDGATTALGLDTTAAINLTGYSAGSAAKAGTAYNLTDGTSTSSLTDISGAIDSVNDIAEGVSDTISANSATWDTVVDMLPLSGGHVSGSVDISAASKQLVTIGTNAFQIGTTRMDGTTPIGTTWMGVNGSNDKGFLKYIDGGVSAAENGTSLQVNFGPSTNGGYGEIILQSIANNVTGESRLINVPTASYNSMQPSSNNNYTTGPNYLICKTASGFDIGAAVVNVTAMPANPAANTYYFVYEIS